MMDRRAYEAALLGLREYEYEERVGTVALFLAERDHGGPIRPPVAICEGYKDEARILVKRLGLELDTDGIKR